jgi:DNA replication initiation complex subunit (GINS family)
MAEEQETITFDLIRKIQREEQRIPKLTKLPPSFYKNVRAYLQHKKGMTNRKKAMESKNIERLVEDIFNRRERKVFNLALIAARTSIPPENLSDEEREFFDQVVYIIKTRRGKLMGPLLDKEPAEQTGLVIFKEEVNAFVGADMKNYGPFNKGDIAKLPDENKKVLLKQKVVDEFKISK